MVELNDFGRVQLRSWEPTRKQALLVEAKRSPDGKLSKAAPDNPGKSQEELIKDPEWGKAVAILRSNQEKKQPYRMGKTLWRAASKEGYNNIDNWVADIGSWLQGGASKHAEPLHTLITSLESGVLGVDDETLIAKKFGADGPPLHILIDWPDHAANLQVINCESVQEQERVQCRQAGG